MREVDEITRRVYFISDDEIRNLNTLKLAQKFSAFYKIPMHLFKDVTRMKLAASHISGITTAYSAASSHTNQKMNYFSGGLSPTRCRWF